MVIYFIHRRGSPNLPVYPTPLPPLPSLITISLLSTAVTLFLFCKEVHLH